MLVPVLLSLDTFPYVSAANLVLLKLYSLVPSFPFELVLSPFLSSLNHVLDLCDTTFPTTFPHSFPL